MLPTRPEPPNTEQILEDVQRAQPNDPVFVLLAEPNEGKPLSDPPCAQYPNAGRGWIIPDQFLSVAWGRFSIPRVSGHG